MNNQSAGLLALIAEEQTPCRYDPQLWEDRQEDVESPAAVYSESREDFQLRIRYVTNLCVLQCPAFTLCERYRRENPEIPGVIGGILYTEDDGKD